MSIKSGQPIAKTTLTAATDSTVTSVTTSGQSHDVTRLIVHDEGGSGATVDLYISSDATSSAGERIEQIVLSANATDQFKPVLVSNGEYLVIQSTAGSVNYHGSYVYRDGGDV